MPIDPTIPNESPERRAEMGHRLIPPAPNALVIAEDLDLKKYESRSVTGYLGAHRVEWSISLNDISVNCVLPALG